MTLDVPDGATIEQVTEPFQLPQKLVHLVLVNGRYIAPADRATLPLQPQEGCHPVPPTGSTPASPVCCSRRLPLPPRSGRCWLADCFPTSVT
jgi:hypothetical protein